MHATGVRGLGIHRNLAMLFSFVMDQMQDLVDRAAKYLRQAGYIVYGERIIGGREVDLYAELVRLDLRRRIGVECKSRSSPLSVAAIHEVIAKYQPLFEDDSIDEVLLVTRAGLSTAALELVERTRRLYHVSLTELGNLIERPGSRRSEDRRFVPLWGEARMEVESDYCFILMPFGDTNDVQLVYRNHVKAVIEQRCKLRCERADDIYDITGVMQSVWEGINRARLIVAELTGRNPNVFYELGVAHTLGKPVVMLSQDIEDVPSDLRHLRVILYKYRPDTIATFEDALKRTIDSVLARSAGATAPRGA